MKWKKDAKEGIVVAGGQGSGNSLTQLSSPWELFVDTLGTVYVAEEGNCRVTRWSQPMKRGTVVVGGNGHGNGANQFSHPIGLSFDQHGNLYVVDYGNHRVQQFSLEK
jgi:sugar lactone lactonase YvrE